MIWLNQKNFWLVQAQNLPIMRTTNFWFIQQNIWLIQSNCLVVLTKSEYFMDSTKKFISINQNLFDLTIYLL